MKMAAMVAIFGPEATQPHDCDPSKGGSSEGLSVIGALPRPPNGTERVGRDRESKCSRKLSSLAYLWTWWICENGRRFRCHVNEPGSFALKVKRCTTSPHPIGGREVRFGWAFFSLFPMIFLR